MVGAQLQRFGDALCCLSMKMTPLELAALDAVRTESAEWASVVDPLLLRGDVLSRVNTGGGFFTELQRAPRQDGADPKQRSSQNNVWINVVGLAYGLGIILHLRDGIALLEGYAVGPEDTSKIDLARGRFEIADEPGPISNDS
ncbi:hypothetical protein [Sphingopyxis macrogoltabida]|nr:hypothetical protein [Sphingopyxis macrogoltabida]